MIHGPETAPVLVGFFKNSGDAGHPTISQHQILRRERGKGEKNIFSV